MKIGVNPRSFLYCSVKQVEFIVLGPENVFFITKNPGEWWASRTKVIWLPDFITRLQNSYETECQDCLHVTAIYVVTEIALLQEELVCRSISLGRGAFMNPLCCWWPLSRCQGKWAAQTSARPGSICTEHSQSSLGSCWCWQLPEA